MRARDHLEDLGVDGKIMLKSIFEERIGAWTGLICLITETDGALL